MTENENLLRFPRTIDDEQLGCPDCGRRRIATEIETQSFEYGLGADCLTLSAEVPVRKCLDCGSEFTDHEGETLRHEAICRHLGVMTPVEVESVRKRLKLNRAEFARLTGLGEASLARWESGALIQNPANDALLHLLTFRDNLERLKSREGAKSKKVEPAIVDGAYRFRAVADIAKARAEGATFLLRRA